MKNDGDRSNWTAGNVHDNTEDDIIDMTSFVPRLHEKANMKQTYSPRRNVYFEYICFMFASSCKRDIRRYERDTNER